MLNPKLIEIYGKEVGDMLEKLALEIGAELSSKCYILEDSKRMRVGGVSTPCSMVTYPEYTKSVEDGVYRFANKYNGDNEEYWIIVLDDGVGEGDIQLWV